MCDLGFGFPELRALDLGELLAVRGKLGLPIERDAHIDLPQVPLWDYKALSHDRIVIP